MLAAFKQRYRRSGFLVDTGGELPDYLPMVLEYAAIVDPVDGAALLQEYRSSVELLRLALAERGTPYARSGDGGVQTLPGAFARRPQGRDGDGADRPSDGDGRPGAEGSSTASDGEVHAMNVLLWGVLPYVMMAS